jgi:beta-1,4-mannosyltransferase
MLLDALNLYEMRAREVNRHANERNGDGRLPKVLMIVTGKGPLRERYMKEVESLQTGSGSDGNGGEGIDGWKWVRCISLWLEAEDYPVLLGLSLILPPLPPSCCFYRCSWFSPFGGVRNRR